MIAWNCSFVTSFDPTTATSSGPSAAVPVPPQPAATSASVVSARKASRVMEKAPFAAFSSRCPARGQYSIDQSERLGKTFLAHADLAAGDRVDGGVDAAAEVA